MMEHDKSQQLPQIVVEYIDEVIKKMGWRRKVRQDVRRELTDHFTDALDHLSTEEEKLSAAKEIIEEFGSPALLGKLMRRAKKRCRHWWIIAVIRSFQAVGLLISLVLLYTAWFMTGEPTITTDYLAEFNNIAKPKKNINDDQNAALVFDQAIELYIPFDKEHIDDKLQSDGFRPDDLDFSTLTEKDETRIEKWIADNTETLKLCREGCKKPYFWRRYKAIDNELLRIELPDMSGYRNIVRLMLWYAYLDAKKSDFKNSFECVLNVYKIGRHLKNQKTITEQLTGIAILSLSTDTLRVIINDFDLDRGSLNYVNKELMFLIYDTDFSINIEFEYYVALDELQRCYVTTSIGDHLYLKRAIMHLIVSSCYMDQGFVDIFKILFSPYDKRKSIEEVNVFYKNLKAYSNKMPYQVDNEEDILKGIETDVILSLLLPDIDKCSMLAYSFRNRAESTVIVTALMLYKIDNGNFPDSLDKLLCENYIEKASIDPYSGKSLIYRKINESFILYGIGRDKVDNNGDKKYDAVFWPLVD